MTTYNKKYIYDPVKVDAEVKKIIEQKELGGATLKHICDLLKRDIAEIQRILGRRYRAGGQRNERAIEKAKRDTELLCGEVHRLQVKCDLCEGNSIVGFIEVCPKCDGTGWIEKDE